VVDKKRTAEKSAICGSKKPPLGAGTARGKKHSPVLGTPERLSYSWRRGTKKVNSFGESLLQKIEICFVVRSRGRLLGMGLIWVLRV